MAFLPFKCLQCGKTSFGRADHIQSGRKKFCCRSCKGKFYGKGSLNPFWSGKMLGTLSHVDDARDLPISVKIKMAMCG